MAYHPNLPYIIIVMICQFYLDQNNIFHSHENPKLLFFFCFSFCATSVIFDKIENSTVCIYEENQNGDKSHFPQGSHGFTTVHKHYNDNVLRPTYYERVLVRLVLMVFCYRRRFNTWFLDSKKECAIQLSH